MPKSPTTKARKMGVAAATLFKVNVQGKATTNDQKEIIMHKLDVATPDSKPAIVGQAGGMFFDSIVGSVSGKIGGIKNTIRTKQLANKVAQLAVEGKMIEYPADYAEYTPEEKGTFLETVIMQQNKTYASGLRNLEKALATERAERLAGELQMKTALNSVIDTINGFEIVSS